MDRGQRPLTPRSSFESRVGRLREQAASGLGCILSTYLRRISPGIYLSGVSDLERLGNTRPRRAFLCYRNEDVLALALVLCRPEAERHLGEVDFVCDDGFSGCVSAVLVGALGRRVRWLHRGALGQRARDVQRIIASRNSLGIAVDTGGPYGQVRPSLARLASGCQALLIPVVARASPVLRFWRQPMLGLPLPGARLAVVVGDPLEGGDPAAPDLLQDALDRADEHARRIVAYATHAS